MRNVSMLAVTVMIMLLGFTAVLPLDAEGIRTRITGTVRIDPTRPDGETIGLRFNEAVGVLLPADTLFVQGIEFELRLPKAVQGSESSISWTVYSSVDPDPSGERLDFNGARIISQPLPARVSMVIQIPVVDRHELRSGPFVTVIPKLMRAGDFPLMFKLAPIGKGFGPSTESAEFRLTVRPVLTDEGGISVSCAFPEGAEPVPYSVYIDDKRVEDVAGPIVLRKGARVVRVSAEGYREEVVSLSVEAGAISKVSVNLVPDAPRLQFEAPTGSIISLNGVPVPSESFDELAIEPGEHTVVCRIGDYTITRKFVAVRGKTYRVIMSVELSIQAGP
ncbi:MAG: hypothetical protein A3J97_15330 [Spirochaetes bacterium RIFOXYC1_FULL_54_7]|nr:MAG: hypothetical protein A3J97_15330 [Spirochaetes bacterium RIFOXYC1_FULL_54_7]